MKIAILAGAAGALFATAAFADDHKMEWTDEMKEWKAECEATKSEESMTDCGCLTEKAFSDEAAKADLDEYESMDTLGEAGKEAVMACQMHEDMEGDH